MFQKLVIKIKEKPTAKKNTKDNPKNAKNRPDTAKTKHTRRANKKGLN